MPRCLGTINIVQRTITHSFPSISKDSCDGIFRQSLNFPLDISISGVQYARVSKNAKFRTKARMFLAPCYNLIVNVIVKLDCRHAFRCDLFKKIAKCSQAQAGVMGMFVTT